MRSDEAQLAQPKAHLSYSRIFAALDGIGGMGAAQVGLQGVVVAPGSGVSFAPIQSANATGDGGKTAQRPPVRIIIDSHRREDAADAQRRPSSHVAER